MDSTQSRGYLIKSKANLRDVNGKNIAYEFPCIPSTWKQQQLRIFKILPSTVMLLNFFKQFLRRMATVIILKTIKAEMYLVFE